MAYGLKYISTAYGISSSLWKVELLEKDYVPADGETPINLSFVDEGITIGDDREDDRFNTIYSKYAIINFKSTALFNINTLQFDDEKKYQIKIYKGSTLNFVGWLIPFYSSEDYEDVSISKISVQAKDGINQLKNISFVDEHPEIASNKQSFKDIICQCLRNIGYNLNTEIYYNKYDLLMNKTSTDCPLAQLYFNVSSLEKNDNEYINYYDVLFRLLSAHDLHIKQVGGVWRIVSQVEVIDGQVTGRKYNSNGEYLGINVFDTDSPISVEGFKIKRGAIIRKDIPFRQFSAFYKADLVVNILPNGKFNQFSGLNPINWTKVGTWGISEVSTILNSNGIQFDNTFTNSEGLDSKYFESSEIDITGLSSFTFRAEAYADSDIDSVKVAIILYNSSISTYKYYVDKYGSVKETPVTAIIDKGTEDKYVSFDLSFITNSATQYLNGVDRIKIRIYPGVKLSGGTPTKKKVRYRNLILTGQSNNYDSEFLGRAYQISNENLQGSKIADEYDVYYQDNISASVARFRNTLFVGDTSNVTNAWKRTSELETNTLRESVLIDRLSLCAKFNDIFEGEITGYIDNSSTPILYVEDKRFLILHSEYIVQTNTTEMVMVVLSASEISFSKKIYDRYKENKTIDVSDSKGSVSIKGSEQFDAPIKSTGGTMYGGLYVDYGIDSLPATSTDPRATNKGLLVLGPVNAQNIELGNFANNTLVEILGRLGIRNTNNFLGEFSVAGLTDNRVATLPDRNIEINKWADLSGVPTSFTPTTHFHEIGEVNGLSVALAGKQPLNANLTSLGLINTNGIVRRTGVNTFGIGTNDQITLSGDVTGTGTTSIATTLSETGVVAGTYRSVTVGIDGRVTDATTPTTIAGYGITDFWEQTLGGVFTPLNETIDSFDTLREVAEKVQGQLNTKQSKIDLYSGYDEALYNGVLVTDGGFLNWKVLDSDAISNFSTSVLGQVLTGFTAGSNTPITSSNTILSAFQDLQAQATANKNSLSGTLNYIPKFNSTSSIGNSTISDDGSVINIGDVAFLQDIVEGRKINLNYPVHFGNSRMYDNTGDDGVNVLVVDTTTLQLDVENVNVIGRLDISENLLSLAKKKYTTSDTWYASIDALYSELLITSSKTSFIGPVGVSVIGGIDGANVTTNNLWNFSVIPQVTYDATLSNQLVRLSQVQSLLSGGFSVSTTCVLAFDTDQSFTGAKTQGSYTTQTGDSILLTKQNAAHQNGVYVFDGTNWARNTANDTDPEIRGKGHLITNGTFANAQFVNNNSSFISMGSTAITYAQWSGSELDPIFTAHAAFNVTNTKISNWDAAFGWGNHNIQGYVKNTGDESIGGIKTFTAEFRGTDLRYSGTLKPSGYSPTGGGMVLMSASTTTNYWKTLAISDITGLQTEIDSKATTDANLVAISALNTNGFIKRTGVGTYAIDTTAYVNKAGDTMTGALNLANSVRVGGTGSSDDNTYLGKNALISRTTSGVGNTAIGASALGSDTSGANNTSLGRNSGASVTTGSYNLFLGSNVGSGITTGSNNVVIGGQVTGLSATLANNIIIADGAGNRRINVGSTGLVGFGLTSPAYRVDVSGDVNVTGMYRLNGSIGLDHQFLKSNGTTQEWATLNCGEISDIDTLYASKTFVDANYVKRITDEGERGFYLYADTENTVKEGFLFTNPDTGILGLHAYRLNGSIIEQYGFQLDKDGLPYWQYANGTRKRILTELDAVGGGSWNGGSVSNAVRFGNNTPILWMNPSETNLANHLGKIEYGLSSSSKVFTDGGGQPFTGGVGLLVESLTNVFLGAVNSIYIKGNKVYINNIELDMAKVAALIGK